MRLDPKYFVPFIIVVALVAALLIAFFTMSSQRSMRQEFEQRITKQDTLRQEAMPLLNDTDSLRVADFKGRYVVLDFWSTWANFSESSHQELAKVAERYPNRLKVMAAVVEDRKKEVDDYMERHSFPFEYVNGTKVFNKYQVPGVPTQLVYNPEGQIIGIFFGYDDASQYDSLRTLLGHEQ